ncbi:dioxygenase family protein [Catenuloplanes japonicus]|uniref:dioxygenase family protein n=1 Tax=Catenuloplanes japonicus TaxID=33876 RepID=UPI000AB588A9|nr:hypothetical protein [Catenuloplanes japonicus]
MPSSLRDRVRRRVLTTLLGVIDNRTAIRRAATLDPGQATAGQGNGPYYIAGSPVRRDVREDRDGIPLLLRLRVVRTGTLAPLPGATVEIWHCDAQGVYSGYQRYGADRFPALISLTLRRFRPTDDAMFLRGTQTTDESGHVEFLTVVPGWYTPRTLHIHAQVSLDGKAALGTELYFPDDFASHVQSLPPYVTRGPGPYRNNTDIEIRLAKGSPGSWPAYRSTEDGHRADITLQLPG